MLHTHDHQKKPTASQMIGRFIQQYRIIFLILALAVVLLPIAYFVVDQINEKGKYDAKIKLYELQDEYNNYNSAKVDGKEDKIAETEKKLMSFIEETITGFKGRYVEFKAREIRAEIELDKIMKEEVTDKSENMKSVIADYSAIIDRDAEFVFTPKITLEVGALIENLPVVSTEKQDIKIDNITVQDLKNIIPENLLENDGNPVNSFADIALALYLYSSKVQPKSPFILETLVDIARIYEDKGMSDEALTIYEKLETDYSNNDWTNIAINRRIALQAKE